MEIHDITGYRLANQQIVNTSYKSPGKMVSFMGALQAQDYPASLWAMGLRLKNATKKDIEEAIEKKEIVRTWPMRQTLHFVSPKDVRWMLDLYRHRTIPNYQKKNGLNEKILEQGEKIIANAFGTKRKLSSKELYAKMRDSGIPALKNHEVQAHILRRAGRDGIVCYASHEGKQSTFALLDEWIEERQKLTNEKALEELALRYFTSHGPATINDYVWWSGLRVSEARIGVEKASEKLAKEEIDGKTYYMPKKMPKITDDHNVHLLPAFDEYLISYKDRSAMLADEDTQKMLTSGKIFFANSNGIFMPIIVADGQVVGTWKRAYVKGEIEITTKPFIKFDKEQTNGIKEAAERYSNFIEVHVKLM